MILFAQKWPQIDVQMLKIGRTGIIFRFCFDKHEIEVKHKQKTRNTNTHIQNALIPVQMEYATYYI